MIANKILWAVLLSVLPISELRGGIPMAVIWGKMGFLPAYLMCVGLNALVAPFVYIFLNTFHKLFLKWNWYAKLFDKIVNRARNKLHDKIEKYGYLGLTIFVGIPLPITGAWTGTLGAWIMNLDKKKSILCAALGCIISGTIVTTLVFLYVKYGAEALGPFFELIFNLFVKETH